MAWNIGVHTNTLRMNPARAERLVADARELSGQYIGYDEKEGLSFDPDAMEHMDFFGEQWAHVVLAHPETNGDVVFLSAEGDNRGDIWGYRYKNGERVNLVAEVTFTEMDPFSKD